MSKNQKCFSFRGLTPPPGQRPPDPRYRLALPRRHGAVLPPDIAGLEPPHARIKLSGRLRNGVFTRSSKRPAIHVYFEWSKFAGRLLDRVNTL